MSEADQQCSVSSSTYAAFFPSGIEDVVLASLSRLARRYALTLVVYTYSSPSVRGGCSALDGSREEASTEDSLRDTPQGLLLFRLCLAKKDSSEAYADTATVCAFLAAACTVRTVERLCLHLWSIPITSKTNDDVLNGISDIVKETAELTHHRVMGTLSQIRTAWATLRAARDASLPRAALLWGPQFFTPLTDTDVSFRVSCERRVTEGRPGALKSMQLAAAAGDALWERHHPHQWEVSMLYHNVDFFLLQDQDQWLTCALTLSQPPPPRCGHDIDVTFQYGAELLRQHVGAALRRGEIALDQVKGLVPRVSADRHEVRWSKGACAMQSSLASALCTYAAVADAAAASTSPVLMLDPFCGSGTTLLEAWVQLLEEAATQQESAAQPPSSSDSCRPGGGGGGGVILGSELDASDVSRTLRNTRHDYLDHMAALYGYGPHCRSAAASSRLNSLHERVEAWRVRVENRVADIIRSGAYLSCGQDGLRDLLCTDVAPLVDPTPSPSNTGGVAMMPPCRVAFAAFRCDATRVPLRAGAVECIVSDMPFGRRCGTHQVNVRLYPRFVRECYRLLRSPAPSAEPLEQETKRLKREEGEWWRQPCSADGIADVRTRGGRAVLLTIEHRLMLHTLESLRTECPFDVVTPPFQVDMNGLFPFVFVLDKR